MKYKITWLHIEEDKYLAFKKWCHEHHYKMMAFLAMRVEQMIDEILEGK